MYIEDLFNNVTLTLHNETLTSQKPCQHNNKRDYSKQPVIEAYVAVFKYRYSYRYSITKNT